MREKDVYIHTPTPMYTERDVREGGRVILGERASREERERGNVGEGETMRERYITWRKEREVSGSERETR